MESQAGRRPVLVDVRSWLTAKLVDGRACWHGEGLSTSAPSCAGRGSVGILNRHHCFRCSCCRRCCCITFCNTAHMVEWRIQAKFIHGTWSKVCIAAVVNSGTFGGFVNDNSPTVIRRNILNVSTLIVRMAGVVHGEELNLWAEQKSDWMFCNGEIRMQILRSLKLRSKKLQSSHLRSPRLMIAQSVIGKLTDR